MKYLLLAIAVIATIGCGNKNQSRTSEQMEVVEGLESATEFFVGTYTPDKPYEEGGSQGIYKYEINSDGQMKQLSLAATTNNPSYLTKSSNGKFLIAVTEVNSKQEQGTVESYEISKDSDTLMLVSTSLSGGAHPCHVSIDSEDNIVVSNYTGGNLGLLRLEENGKLSPVLDVQQHTGKGTTDRQEGPHAHSAWFRPDGRGIIAADLGTNELWFSDIENGKFVPHKTPKLAMAEGAGPRHLTFSTDKKFVYVLNELDNTVGTYKIGAAGQLIDQGTVPMLPESFTSFSKAADIHVSPNGKFLYASNRGHNSIVIYKIDQDGNLDLVAHESVRGDSPRNFQISKNGKFLIAANQKTNNLVSYSIDQESGKLTYLSETFAPTPVCILF